MGRSPCCSKVGLHKGSWSAEEDALLTNYIQANGEGHWRSLPLKAGLLRCGKSCRLRWMNYLRPGVKRGNFTADEEDLIIRLQSLLGNRWSLIAGRLPGRTDNEIKNHWNIHILKRLKKEGIEPKKSHQSSFKTRGKQPKHKNPASATRTGTDHPVPGHNPKEDEASPEKKLITMTKVYAPKPIRLRRTRFAASDCIVGSSAAGKSSPSSNQEEVDKEEARPEESAGIAWSSFEQLGEEWYEGVDEFISNEDQILVDGFDLSVHGEVPVSDDLLEQVYAEYLSIFNLDAS